MDASTSGNAVGESSRGVTVGSRFVDDSQLQRAFQKVSSDALADLIHSFLLAKQMKTDNRPCLVEPGLYVGSIGAAHNKDLLQDLDISHIVCVANSISAPFPETFDYTLVDVLDSPQVDLRPRFAECFAAIDKAKESGSSALVHCFAGMSRSVTVVAAYLMKEHGWTPAEALAHIRKSRSVARPNSGFYRQLEEYHSMLQSDRAGGVESEGK